jgi:hypothetical protein
MPKIESQKTKLPLILWLLISSLPGAYLGQISISGFKVRIPDYIPDSAYHSFFIPWATFREATFRGAAFRSGDI